MPRERFGMGVCCLRRGAGCLFSGAAPTNHSDIYRTMGVIGTARMILVNPVQDATKGALDCRRLSMRIMTLARSSSGNHKRDGKSKLDSLSHGNSRSGRSAAVNTGPEILSKHWLQESVGARSENRGARFGKSTFLYEWWNGKVGVRFGNELFAFLQS
jgi:hypothetical protein